MYHYFWQEFDAKEIAKVEEERLHDIELQKQRADHERVEKARVRHKHAMEKESLKQVTDEEESPSVAWV